MQHVKYDFLLLLFMYDYYYYFNERMELWAHDFRWNFHPKWNSWQLSIHISFQFKRFVRWGYDKTLLCKYTQTLAHPLTRSVYIMKSLRLPSDLKFGSIRRTLLCRFWISFPWKSFFSKHHPPTPLHSLHPKMSDFSGEHSTFIFPVYVL